jgi:SAM-dependent methyltransferase
MDTQDYRLSHLSKGDDYHSIFHEQPFTAMLWRSEQRELSAIVKRYFPVTPPTHLDFACGTGRIINHLAPLVSDSLGIDVSESMLRTARRNNPELEFVLGDITREHIIPDRKFDLVTAFRFFPNAQPQLRDEVVAALAEMLSSAGILVLNNHLNGDSYFRKLMRKTGRDPGHGMSMKEVEALMERHGFQIREIVGFGIAPIPERVRSPLSSLLEPLEWRLRHWRPLAGKAQDVIVVAAPK